LINGLSNIKKVFFIGIGGIGMSGIAEYLAVQRIEVSGSDAAASEITDRLKTFGIKIFDEHKTENISNDLDLVVYTAAVKEDNPELKKAKEFGIKAIKRAEMLGMTVNAKKLIAVSGAHGKTTTSSMISKVFIDANTDPLIFVGGNLEFLNGSSSRLGKGEYAIVEADEYDRSFLTLHPDIAVINNIEFDHSDIYKDLNDVMSSFKQFISNLKPEGIIVAYSGDENIKNLLMGLGNVKRYGFNEHDDFYISDLRNENGVQYFKINGKELKLSVPGRHNVINAVAAYACGSLYGIENDIIAEALYSFGGVKRRLELKYKNAIQVYDDYAHHPTEVRASFDAVRKNTNGRVITVFQPHLYSRTKDFYKEFANELKDNDVVFLAKLYPAREKPLEGVSSELILNELKNLDKKDSYYFENDSELLNGIKKEIKNSDTLIFQGAGSITNLCDKFIKEYINN
jgi:UDP-N-acetylmuramate--alanine ligase